jgi:hypothetical protein
LKKIIATGFFVGITTQCIYGRVNSYVYSNLRSLEITGAVFLGDMLSETALVKLGWVLGHEEWAGGIKLRGTSAYGVRLYKNGSSLVMHYDKVHSHVISSIVHIAHEYDDEDEPWPIQIEDHNGKLHSVNLEPGQMLFYESAKCLHGRMKTFKGKYYGSIFLHYKPVDTNIWNFNVEKVIASVPPHWRKNVKYENQRSPRYAGAALTIDSISTEHALKIPRVPKFNKNEEDSFFEEDEEDL